MTITLPTTTDCPECHGEREVPVDCVACAIGDEDHVRCIPGHVGCERCDCMGEVPYAEEYPEDVREARR